MAGSRLDIETIVVRTSDLDVACEVSGPIGGPPVFLLHGWPDDPRSWDGVLRPLHARGFRTYVPALRGFGATRFTRKDAPRYGQLSALGKDLIETLDGLGIQRCTVIGHDWGARAAYIACCLAPERFSQCVAISVGWGTNDPDQPLSLLQAQNYWYHWLMALPRGERLVRDDRRALTRHIWSIWSPGRAIEDAEFEATAASFDNPDWADVVLHSYRVRWGHAPVDPRLEDIEQRLKEDPVIRVPTLVLHGGADPCNAPSTSEGKDSLFASGYERIVMPGIGHFPQREDATTTAKLLLDFLETR